MKGPRQGEPQSGSYEPVESEVEATRRTGISLGLNRWRRALLGIVVAGVAVVLTSGACVSLVARMNFHRSLASRSVGDTVSLERIGMMDLVHGPYTTAPSCAPDGRVCICTGGFKSQSSLPADGKSFHQKAEIQAASGTDVVCQPWKFKVGDVVFMEKPSYYSEDWRDAYMLSAVTRTPNVHVAIVSEVPPESVGQTGDNVVVTEDLKGDFKQVVQTKMRTVVERFPFGGFSIRRVDEHRFPQFFSEGKQRELASWCSARIGERFDTEMLNLVTRKMSTFGRYVTVDPGCDERKRALAMFHGPRAGPGQYVCSSLAAWALAFAGGLNTDYDDQADACDVPTWRLNNLQPDPGQLMAGDFFDASLAWHVPCNASGCFLAVPQTPEWAGGTTGAPAAAPAAAPGAAAGAATDTASAAPSAAEQPGAEGADEASTASAQHPQIAAGANADSAGAATAEQPQGANDSEEEPERNPVSTTAAAQWAPSAEPTTQLRGAELLTRLRL